MCWKWRARKSPCSCYSPCIFQVFLFGFSPHGLAAKKKKRVTLLFFFQAVLFRLFYCCCCRCFDLVSLSTVVFFFSFGVVAAFLFFFCLFGVVPTYGPFFFCLEKHAAAALENHFFFPCHCVLLPAPLSVCVLYFFFLRGRCFAVLFAVFFFFPRIGWLRWSGASARIYSCKHFFFLLFHQ